MSAEEQKYNPEQEELHQARRDFGVRFLDEVLLPHIGEGLLIDKAEIIPMYQAFQVEHQGQMGSDFSLKDAWNVAFVRDIMFTNTADVMEVLEEVDFEVFEAMAEEITVAERLLWELSSEGNANAESNRPD